MSAAPPASTPATPAATRPAEAGARRCVIVLGLGQVLAWASSYYLPALLAVPMARELGLAPDTVYAVFSAALVAAALVGPLAGRAIDRHGGRPVLSAASLLFAAGLATLALAPGPWPMAAGWLLIGLGMGAGLYDGAFAALVHLLGPGARGAITGVTLFGGFASTVGWPLSAALEAHVGWRGACGVWAALHLLAGLPLHLSLPRRPFAAPTSAPVSAPPGAPAPPGQADAEAEVAEPAHAARTTALLAWVFAVVLFVSTALATHLPGLLQGAGLSLAAAVAIGALVGPAQVAGRLLEFGWLRHRHPLLSARLAALAHPLGVAALMLLGPPAAAAFALLHGLGNGILTIAKGTLPLAFFGAAGYGRRLGWLLLPARLAQALAPWLFGLVLLRWGSAAMLLSAGLGLSALAALLMLRRPAA